MWAEYLQKLKTFLVLLFPLVAEQIRDSANSSGNLAFYAIGSTVCGCRNIAYFSLILACVMWWYGWTIACGVAALVSAVGMYRIWDLTIYFMQRTDKNKGNIRPCGSDASACSCSKGE